MKNERAELDRRWAKVEVREAAKERAKRLADTAPALLAALKAVATERDFVVRCNDHIQAVVADAINLAEGKWPAKRRA